ncbi:MAG: type II secretion system F family protein [Pseudomonadota bacterium]|nr:type II secretion system F family protein [Pseudomonadota bacterium]
MQFRIRALDQSQRLLTLTLDAADEADASEQVISRHLTPLSVTRSGAKLQLRRRKAFDLLLFVQEFNTLVRAGLSVIETLEALVEKEAGAETRAILARLISQLRSGMRLSQALQQQSEIFPSLLVGIVAAAEGTSDLPRALSRYLHYETRMRSVREKVASSAIYPAILLSVGGAVSLFLLGYVVPRFAAIYQTGNRELPLGSKLLLGWGAFAQQHSVVIVTTFVTVLIGVALWARRQFAQGTWWQTLTLLPGLRQRVALFELSRLYLTLGMLLEGGITVQRALRLARAVLSPALQVASDRVREQVESGGTLSDALATSALSTPISLRLIRAGEQSGQLGPMLTQSAAFYEDENARWIERFTRTFEPLLMAVIGIVIGGIVVLLYMPIFDLAGSIQ